MKTIDFSGYPDEEFAKFKEFDTNELAFFEFSQKQIQIDKFTKINSNLSKIVWVMAVVIMLSIFSALFYLPYL